MKTRNGTRSYVDITKAQFEDAMARFAAAERRENEINGQIENSINEILADYEDELHCLAQGKSLAFGMVQAYCTHNKETLFGRRRSIGTLHGTAGFRLGTPRLKTSRGSNWQKVLANLKAALPDYVRTTEEPARDRLLADRHKEHVAPMLISLGIEVVQDELFYLEAAKAA